MLAEQLGGAAEALRVGGGPDAEAVHDVRKRLKRARSMLRLARADLGPAVARHGNDQLRRVGGDLARQRDADALVEAVDRLSVAAVAVPASTSSAAPATIEALAVVHGLLTERAEQVRDQGGLDRATVIGAARTLEQSVAWLNLVPARATGWDALAPGFARQYQRGRDSLLGLADEPSVDELHEWRKRVKDLWHHQRLLRKLWPEAQRPLVDAAAEVAGALGDDHDLGLLLAHLASHADDGDAYGRSAIGTIEPLPLAHEVRRLATAAAVASRSDLQGLARRLGARLYADDPRAWRARHGAWWDAARHDLVPEEGADRVGRDAGTAGLGPLPDPSPDEANA